ncbi:MAG: fibronectin type III domain-containing protein [Thermodesulfobacteriota bacterium]
MRSLLGALLLALAALPAGPAYAAERLWATAAFPAAVQAAVAAGELDRAEADLYWLYAVKAPERLPDGYRAPAAAARAARSPAGGLALLELRCATPILRAVRSRLDQMPPAVRREAEALLQRPASGPRGALRRAGKSVTHVLPNWIETENFSFEWGPDLTAATGQAAVDADGNGLPDVVEQWASYFETAYALARELGFTHPILDQELVPVYLGNSDPDSAIDDIGGSFLGFTAGEPGELPYIVVQGDLRVDTWLNDEGSAAGGTAWDRVEANVRGTMKIVAAHEFFHVLHFLYEPPVWNSREDDWWLEATATWFEDEVFDGVNQYYSRFDGPTGWAGTVELGLPVPLLLDDPTVDYTIRAYGAVIFAKYLAEHGGGRASQRDLFDLIRAGPEAPPGRRPLEALDAYARTLGYDGLEELYLGFAAANAGMDYEEGAHFGFPGGTVPVRKRSLDADSAADTLPDTDPARPLPVPAYLGATYLAEGGFSGGLRVGLRGTSEPGSSPWGLALRVRRAGGYAVVLGSLDPGGLPEAEVSSLGPGDEILAAVSFLGPAETPTGYATEVSGAAIPAFSLPAPVLAAPVALPGRGADRGGVRLAWAPVEGAAGYVLRWRSGPQEPLASRTLFGHPTDPQTGRVEVELRSLQAGGTYEVRVLAYGPTGAAGAEAVLPGVRAGGAPATGLAPVRVLAQDVSVPGINVPERSAGSKGIGGVECFLRALVR